MGRVADLLRRYLKSEKAQSVTELALSFPLLTWVLFGTVDFARVYYLQVAVSNAARTGAQFAVDSRHSADEGRSVIVQEAAPYVNIGAQADITLTATPSWGPGGKLQVVVVQRFNAITPFISAIWGGGAFTVTGSNVVRFNP